MKQEKRSQQSVGVAWYTPEQWRKLRAVADDSERLEASYVDWLFMAKEALRQLASTGVEPRKVEVDTEELLAWCKAQGCRVNGPARAQFVSEQMNRDLLPSNEHYSDVMKLNDK
jgi:hypothetical protein